MFKGSLEVVDDDQQVLDQWLVRVATLVLDAAAHPGHGLVSVRDGLPDRGLRPFPCFAKGLLSLELQLLQLLLAHERGTASQQGEGPSDRGEKLHRGCTMPRMQTVKLSVSGQMAPPTCLGRRYEQVTGRKS